MASSSAARTGMYTSMYRLQDMDLECSHELANTAFWDGCDLVMGVTVTRAELANKKCYMFVAAEPEGTHSRGSFVCNFADQWRASLNEPRSKVQQPDIICK